MPETWVEYVIVAGAVVFSMGVGFVLGVMVGDGEGDE